MKSFISIIIFCLATILAFSQQNSYRCFDCDNNVNLRISVKYIDDTPVSLKYKGQDSSVLLQKIKGSILTQDGNSAFTESYNEIISGQSNGKYIFTHSGIYDYIQYIRKDGKKFEFTINLDDSIFPNGGEYRITPCF